MAGSAARSETPRPGDRADATKAFDAFPEDYSKKYPKATECLKKDRDVLLTFYDFPAEHWRLNRPAMLAHRRETRRLEKARQTQTAVLAHLAELNVQLQALSNQLRQFENDPIPE